MPKVKQQTAGKIGLLAAILYVVGTVLGIGIFFKNNTVFRLNDSNAIGVLMSWALSIIIVLCMAVSFAEISTCKTKSKNPGVGNWTEQFCGHKFGRYAKTGFQLMFWPVNTIMVLFFAGEALLKCFAPLLGEGRWTSFGYDYGKCTTLYIFLIGAVLFVIFMVLNYFKSRAMTKAGSIISYVKFAPVLMVAVLGIAFGIMWNQGGAWSGHLVGGKTSGAFNIIGVFSAIPAILYAFEGYISVCSLRSEIRDPDKNFSAAVVLGVAALAILYVLVTIGCITGGSGNAYDLFGMVKDHSEVAYKVLTTAISVFIFICIVGSINGMAKGSTNAFTSFIEDGDLFKSKKLVNLKPGNSTLGGAISFSIVTMALYLFILIPSSIMNTDAIGDGLATAMVIVVYVIYTMTVLGGFINRFTKKVEVKKNKIFPVAAVIALIGCLFMIGYIAIFQYTVSPIISGLSKPNSESLAPAGWGMFVESTKVFANWEILMWYWIMTAVVALLPVINDLLIKGFDKQNTSVLMWQSVKKQVVLK